MLSKNEFNLFLVWRIFPHIKFNKNDIFFSLFKDNNKLLIINRSTNFIWLLILCIFENSIISQSSKSLFSKKFNKLLMIETLGFILSSSEGIIFSYKKFNFSLLLLKYFSSSSSNFDSSKLFL